MLSNCWRRLLRVLEQQEIKPVNPKGNQLWIIIGKTDAEAEAPIPLLPEELTHWKDLDAGKEWGQKGAPEDEMVEWHRWFNGHEFERAAGDGEGHGSLVLYSPRGRKELHTTELLNNSRWAVVRSLTELYKYIFLSHIQIWRIIFGDIKSKRLHAHKFLLWFWFSHTHWTVLRNL